MEQKSPRRAIMVRAEMATLKTIQGEAFTHHIRCETKTI